MASKPEEAGSAETLTNFLNDLLQTSVIIKLNSGLTFQGDLQAIDGYMNISLENCRELRDGRVTRNWGDAFIRGNTVSYIRADGE